VSHVVHFGRRPNAYQLTALEYAHPTCTREGCDNPIQQYDHRVDYAQTHHTVLEEMDGPCLHDHALKTFHNWQFVQGTGRRPMVPPSDPRHPNNSKHPSPTSPP
jgi:hypothetical protein